MSDEVMMPRKTSDALEQSHILALRQISDGLAQTNRLLERQANKLQEMHDKMVKVESLEIVTKFKDMKDSLDAACARIDRLETDKDRRDGATGFFEWAGKVVPWVLALLAALGAPIVSKHLGG